MKYRQKLWEEYQKIIHDQELDINIELSIAISSAIQKQNLGETSNVLTELNNLQNNYKVTVIEKSKGTEREYDIECHASVFENR